MPNDTALVQNDDRCEKMEHHGVGRSSHLKIDEVLRCTPKIIQRMNKLYLKNEYTHE
jgi:hypothetical protein